MPYRLLFVCLGNICRSPAAEGVLKKMISDAGLQHQVEIDSAGTGGWHAGDLPDHRMRQHASKRGYLLDSRARQVRSGDFADFDLIVVMDRANQRDIASFANDKQSMSRVRQFCDFLHDRDEAEVPDPYYDGADGFELVLDIVENGCTQLLRHIRSQLKQPSAQARPDD
jgi:protein-tyrosine phosphatase